MITFSHKGLLPEEYNALKKGSLFFKNSLRQGYFREKMSEGSLEQIWEPTNRNLIEGRPPFGVAQGPPWGKSAQHDNAL